ncbi:MAG: type II toxin-antitoxin system death-on-curing family toxin [Dehalococcoidia bacterium]|nr:type II toxin-antitoxin system death-on-curing family toxin [Dehalococcoidia bacterium]
MYALAAEFYPDYPDPMPAFQFLGGDHGRGLLESALAGPQQQFAGRYLHRTIYDKAAALFRSLIKNHPLLDGNKRLALTSVFVFLTINGIVLYVPRDEAVRFALRVAAGDPDVPLKEISSWLRRYSIAIEALRATPPADRERWYGVLREDMRRLVIIARLL